MHYQDFVNNPVNTLADIAQFTGIGWQPHDAQSVHAYLEANPRHQHGAHIYDLEQFHLERGTLRDMYREYQLTHLQR